MICFAALDLVLREFRAGMMRITFVVEIVDMNPDDRAADLSGFGIPPHPISNPESFSHLRLPCRTDPSRDDSLVTINCVSRFYRGNFEIARWRLSPVGRDRTDGVVLACALVEQPRYPSRFSRSSLAADPITRADAGPSDPA